MPRFTICLVAAALIELLSPAVPAQGVAFQEVPGTLTNGPTLTVTPSVSADRRYVRLTLNPYFNAVQGFDPFVIPSGAVSGAGGGGGNGGGGLPGLGGGGGGAGRPAGLFAIGVAPVPPKKPPIRINMMDPRDETHSHSKKAARPGRSQAANSAR